MNSDPNFLSILLFSTSKAVNKSCWLSGLSLTWIKSESDSPSLVFTFLQIKGKKAPKYSVMEKMSLYPFLPGILSTFVYFRVLFPTKPSKRKKVPNK